MTWVQSLLTAGVLEIGANLWVAVHGCICSTHSGSAEIAVVVFDGIVGSIASIFSTVKVIVFHLAFTFVFVCCSRFFQILYLIRHVLIHFALVLILYETLFYFLK